MVLLVTTSRLCERNASSISLRFISFGCPLDRATILIENVLSKSVCLYKLFKSTSETVPLLRSITTLSPSLSDSSRISEMPSIFLSLTSSAIFSINLALLTWYGSSETTIDSRSPFSSIEVFALT